MFKLIFSVSFLTLGLISMPLHFSDASGETSYTEPTIEAAVEEEKVTIDSIKEKIHPNLSTEEITDTFGDPDQRLTDSMYNLPTWRYDIKINEDYESKTGTDSVDFQALKDKELQAIIFFSFDDNENIRNISVYYLNKDGKVQEYRQFADGFEKNTVIE
ncbi:hypothetical protein AB1L05_02905 [Cytobacillus horneckiae]|uniref:Lipoprotein SmpA/OmlA domain-containing protein n=1 Tax=Cytobacillus horneckiae TaxID=549687 RepID=A0A2N0ZLK9_9BACI|nr:hypothetical protein [Cytobacillus horneckiae]MEC1156067.1 hypothetical protein [Cytobacillus horneckiae]MED2937427.1 hypothetical protein [Cytobacillus horneckiae]PKG30389.1 hypothetical protein CWS20_05195 [Cytobacillus horneckiae]